MKFAKWSKTARCIGMTAVLLISGVVVVGTSRALARENRESIYAILNEAPDKAKTRQNPLAGEPEAVAAGGKLFAQHCAECHGQKAGGTMRGANLLSDEMQQAAPGTIFWILTNGVVRRGMPVWSKLPEPQRWQIVTFLQTLRPRAAPPNKAGPGQ